nr:MAG TPA: hypothetical protein [Caudoviricetes sp.]
MKSDSLYKIHGKKSILIFLHVYEIDYILKYCKSHLRLSVLISVSGFCLYNSIS